MADGLTLYVGAGNTLVSTMVTVAVVIDPRTALVSPVGPRVRVSASRPSPATESERMLAVTVSAVRPSLMVRIPV